MARISLRDYTREIENLIENGQNEEAIAHSRYILHNYPKNLAVNRLLGKAYLEMGQDREAAEAFKQVLEAVPDDFIAHLGLSVIREHEGDLDASIRHMERAFDVQPANAIIQGELRRLYKGRDGLEPQKIHLTRGALARMYAKGDLYSQAIAELRAALGEDPNRPDLQIVLVKMYAKSGQLLEAAETCSTLLSKLPDCLEAHIVLGDILSRTERSVEAQAHFQRAASLDPYAAYLGPGQPDPEAVPDDSVMMDQLKYTPAEPSFAISPDGQELAEDVEAGPVIEGEPDVEQFEGVEEVELEEETSVPEELPGEHQEKDETPPDAIPDWMQTAGWEPTSTAEEEPEPEFEGDIEEFAEDEEELVKAEIPEWLKPLAPSGAEETDLFEPEEMEEPQASTPWASESEAGQSQAAQPEIEPEGEVPDWLPAAEEGQPEPEGPVPDWLEAAEAEGAGAEADTPDWMKDSEEEQPELVAETADWQSVSQEEQAGSEEELPDWMKAAEGEETEPEGELPDWLRAAEEEGAEPEGELPDYLKAAEGEQAETEEEMPDWLKAAEAEQVGPEAEMTDQDTYSLEGARIFPYSGYVEPETGEAPPEEMSEMARLSGEQDVPEPETGTGLAAEQEAEFPEWMRQEEEDYSLEGALSASEPLMEGQGEAEGTDGEPEVPEWLRSLGEESLAEGGEMPAEEVEMPFLPGSEEPAQAEVPTGGSEVPDWLRSALEEQGQSQAEQPEDIPDWLRSSIPEGFPEEPPPILGDTKPVRRREIEEQLQEEPSQEIFEEQPSTEATEGEEVEAWDEIEEAVETPAEEAEEAGDFDLEESEVEQVKETGAPGAEMEEEEEAAAISWLESLAAREGAKEEELLTRPEERSESIPEWLEELAEVEEAAEPAESSEELVTEQSTWQTEMEVEAEEAEEEATLQPKVEPETEVSEEPAPAIAEMEMEQPSWQPEVEVEEEVAVEQESWQPEVEAEAEVEAKPAEAAGPDAELPEWLRDFAEEETGLPEEEEVLEAETAAPSAEPLDLNTATLAQLERIPGIGYIQAQNIVNYRESHGRLKGREDLENVPGINTDVIERLSEWGTFEQPVEVPAQEEETPEVPPEVVPGEQPPALEQAWGKLVAGDVPTAIDLYGDMIRKEQHLDQVIHELREAAFLYPQEISIHQALGDAYLRANRLQEALDAYNKAEDLLT